MGSRKQSVQLKRRRRQRRPCRGQKNPLEELDLFVESKLEVLLEERQTRKRQQGGRSVILISFILLLLATLLSPNQSTCFPTNSQTKRYKHNRPNNQPTNETNAAPNLNGQNTATKSTVVPANTVWWVENSQSGQTPALHPSAATSANTPPPQTTITPTPTTTDNPRDDSTNSDFAQQLLESASARQELAYYIFNEFHNKNFTDSLDASPSGASQIGSGNEAHAISGGGGSGHSASLAGSSASYNGSSPGHLASSSAPRPYFGDAFYSFQNVYWPIHCVICLVICTLGIFANVTNIIVLTRPNMITAVNAILSAMALSDLVVNISNIPYLMHELGDSTNSTSFYSFQWALYILFHAHTTVTAHTISIWLTCVLATWRYFVVCRSQSSSQRNWSVGLAKRTIIAVFLLVPIFCIPNYLSFAIVKEVTETNSTIYKVGFSHLADESQFIKTFHFWIFSCLTKLVPCVLLTFFTTVLIRKLLSARERRLRLASYATGNPNIKDATKTPLTNGEADRPEALEHDMLVDQSTKHKNSSNRKSAHTNCRLDNLTGNFSKDIEGDQEEKCWSLGVSQAKMSNLATGDLKLAQQSCSSCTIDVEMMATSCMSSCTNSHNNVQNNLGQQRILSQLLVESDKTDDSSTRVLTKTAPTKMLASCDNKECQFTGALNHGIETQRSASTCGALDLYIGKPSTRDQTNDCQPLVGASVAVSQDLHPIRQPLKARMGSIARDSENSNLPTGSNHSDNERFAEANNARRGRSVGSTSLAPMQMVKLQTAQKQISQNETTTRLLIAVMIVFLICEFPAGILAALCAILGQDFFENVYQPTGTLTDLLALINSSVNFILYCFMSTQFRITFYRVVLHCPAPNMPQKTQAMVLHKTNQMNDNKIVKPTD